MIIGLLPLFSCKDNGLSPIVTKDPRTYTWTIDTISYPNSFQTNMYDTYGINASNVYIAGHSALFGAGIIWHYDGIRWSPINWSIYGEDVSLWSITGFGSSDIYAVGKKSFFTGSGTYIDSALILHFNGISWTEMTLPGNVLLTVRGSGPSDIWTGGWMGSVFHFDGVRWSKVEVNPQLSFKDFTNYGGKTYAIAYRLDSPPQDTIWYFSLSFDGQRWDTVDVRLDFIPNPNKSTFGCQSLSIIEGSLFSAGGGVFELKDGRWMDAAGGINVARAFGTGANSIWGVGTYGEVDYFNGFYWYQFDQFKSTEFHFLSGWTDGREVFIVGENNYRTLVLHGR